MSIFFGTTAKISSAFGHHACESRENTMKILTKKPIINVLTGICLLGVSVVLAESRTLTVSATVAESVHFSSSMSTLNFSTLNSASVSNANASISPTVWLSNGTTGTIVLSGSGLYSSGTYNGTMTNGSNSIPYTISLESSVVKGAGKSTPIPVTINANIEARDFINAPAGTYTDTVTLTITP